MVVEERGVEGEVANLCLFSSGCSCRLLSHALLYLGDLVPVVGMVGVVGFQEVELCVPGLVDTNSVLKIQPFQTHKHTQYTYTHRHIDLL